MLKHIKYHRDTTLDHFSNRNLRFKKYVVLFTKTLSTCKIKPQTILVSGIKITLHTYFSVYILKTPNGSQDIQQQDFTNNAGRSENLYNHFGKQALSSNGRQMHTLRPKISHIMQNSYLCETKDVYHNTYRKIICKRQKLKTLHVCVNSKMEKLIVLNQNTL